jgi:putative redox protein
MRPPLCEPPQAGDQFIFRTAGGKDVRVGRPAPGGAGAPGGRVSLHIGRPADGEEGGSEALTPGEARQLAAALVQQAAAAESPADGPAVSRVEVTYLGGESYTVAARGHALLTDQPVAAGGTDTAMTPTELFVASLSSCVAFYAGRYLARHGLNRDGLHITANFATATDRPARVGKIRLTTPVPGGIPPSRQAALLAVAAHCTVHNTLRQPPDIAIELTKPQAPPTRANQVRGEHLSGREAQGLTNSRGDTP